MAGSCRCAVPVTLTRGPDSVSVRVVPAADWRGERTMSEVTRILNAIEEGDPRAAEELLPLVYSALRQLAASRMAKESADHTLQPTALVHEAWLRLVEKPNPTFQNRAHFFAAAAEAMRRILIDRARRRKAVRHGGGQERVDFAKVDLAAPESGQDQLLAVNEALDRLEAAHPLEAQVVKLRYFVGMTNDEAADTLGIAPRTAKYYWTHARAWLYREIQQGNRD